MFATCGLKQGENPKAAKEKQVVTYKGVPIRLSSYLSKKHFKPEGSGMKYTGDKKLGPTTKAFPSKATI